MKSTSSNYLSASNHSDVCLAHHELLVGYFRSDWLYLHIYFVAENVKFILQYFWNDVVDCYARTICLVFPLIRRKQYDQNAWASCFEELLS